MSRRVEAASSKKLFRIAVRGASELRGSGEGERETVKRLHSIHMSAQNVVRQLKIKFIVLDLKSHKSIFFFLLILHHYCFICEREY